MKQVNALVRNGNRQGIVDMGFTETQADAFLKDDYIGRKGFPDYEIRNNTANIRRLKQQSKRLEAHENDETHEKIVNGIRIVDNVEDNRVQIYFPSKPGDATRELLLRNGFHWTPSHGCNQRMRSDAAMYYTTQICAACTDFISKE